VPAGKSKQRSGSVKNAQPAGVPYSPERQQAIMQMLRAEGRIDASKVAHDLAVTNETIRKDLIVLERQGLLRRVHGGALPIGDLTYEPDVVARTEFAEEKDRIAKAALAHVPTSGSVIIDAGSTTSRLAGLFPDDRDLNVFTNALPIALALLSRPRITVYTLGGRLRSRTVATVGQWTTRMLADLNVDVAFLGTNGVSRERGLTTPDPAEAEVKRFMLGSARRKILLADHSKVGRVSLCKHADLTDIDLFITDSGIPKEQLAAIETVGVTVEQA
jgi:DeoR family transcriptional regulator, fructose operon transcriptional repressor